MYFIKLPHSLLDDHQKALLSDRLWRRLIECYLAAGRLNDGGFLPELHNLAYTLHIDAQDLEADLKALEGAGLLDTRPHLFGHERYFLLDWETTQRSQSKSATRKRNYRQNKKVTKEQKQTRGEENREEESILDKISVPDTSGTRPGHVRDMSHSGQNINIEPRTEPSIEPIFDMPRDKYGDEVCEALFSWYRHKDEQGKPLTRQAAAALIVEVDKRGEPAVIEAVNFSLKNNYNTLVFDEMKYGGARGGGKTEDRKPVLSSTMQAAVNLSKMME